MNTQEKEKKIKRKANDLSPVDLKHSGTFQLTFPKKIKTTEIKTTNPSSSSSSPWFLSALSNFNPSKKKSKITTSPAALKNAIRRRDIITVEQCFLNKVPATQCNFNDLIIDLIYKAKTDSTALQILRWMQQGTVDLSVTRLPIMNELGKLNEDKNYTLNEIIIYKNFPLTWHAIQAKLGDPGGAPSWYLACYYSSADILNELIDTQNFLADIRDEGIPTFNNETPLGVAIRGLIKFKADTCYLDIINCLVTKCPEIVLMSIAKGSREYLPYQIVSMEENHPQVEFFLTTQTCEQLYAVLVNLMGEYEANLIKCSDYYDLTLIKKLRHNYSLFEFAHDDLTTLKPKLPLKEKFFEQNYQRNEKLLVSINEWAEILNFSLNETDAIMYNPKSKGIS